MESTLVIDVGTATTMASVVVGGQEPLRVREPDPRGDHWKTSVAPHPDGMLVGWAAERPGTQQGLFRGRFLQALGHPGLALPDPFGAPDRLLGEVLSAIRACAEATETEALRAIRTRAEAKAARTIRRLLLTVPDEAALAPGRDHDSVRRGMLRAARLAGFVDVELLSEAAAIALSHPVRAGAPVLVCDAGASALRLTLVRAGDTAAGTSPGTVEASRSVPELGGDALDRALAEKVRTRGTAGRRWGRRTMEAPGWTTQEAWEYQRTATKAREELSTRDELTASPEGLDPTNDTYRRADLRDILREPASKAGQHYRSMLASLPSAGGRRGTAPVQVVLLAGGGGKAPLLAEALQAEFRAAVVPLSDPDFACLRGAEAWAGQAGRRVIYALPHVPGTRALSWDFKDGGALLLRWLVRPGEAFAAGKRLAVVRSKEDDSVSYLTASCSGVMLEHCVMARGTPPVESREVLAVVDARPRRPQDLCSPYLMNGMPDVVAVSPDGRRTLARDAERAGCYECDMETGARPPLRGVPATGGSGDVACGPAAGWVTGRITSAEGKGGRRSRTAEMVSLATGQALIGPVALPGDGPAAIRLSADGTRACLAAGDGIKVLEAGSKRELLARDKLNLWGDPAGSVAFSADGRLVLLARRYQPADRKRKDLKRVSSAEILALPVPPDRSGGKEAPGTSIYYWKEVPLTPPDVRVAVSADGSLAMIAKDAAVTVTDIASRQVLWQRDLPGPVRAADFSADGSILAIITERQPRWDVILLDARDDMARRGDGASGDRQVHHVPLDPLGQAWVRVSPDMRFLIAGDEQNSWTWGLLS